VVQRGVLGFPPPGHPYWTAETIAATAARHPFGIDTAPYERGLADAGLAGLYGELSALRHRIAAATAKL
jgi:hypothetical protein